MYNGKIYKFKNHRCYLWSSRAVVLILVWNLIISIDFKSFFDPSLYAVMFNELSFYSFYAKIFLYGLPYGMTALLFLFYPLAGFLADVCWGRYTTVKNNLIVFSFLECCVNDFCSWSGFAFLYYGV